MASACSFATSYDDPLVLFTVCTYARLSRVDRTIRRTFLYTATSSVLLLISCTYCEDFPKGISKRSLPLILIRSVSFFVIASVSVVVTFEDSRLEYCIACFTENTPMVIDAISHKPSKLSFALKGIDFTLEERIFNPR